MRPCETRGDMHGFKYTSQLKDVLTHLLPTYPHVSEEHLEVAFFEAGVRVLGGCGPDAAPDWSLA